MLENLFFISRIFFPTNWYMIYISVHSYHHYSNHSSKVLFQSFFFVSSDLHWKCFVLVLIMFVTFLFVFDFSFFQKFLMWLTFLDVKLVFLSRMFKFNLFLSFFSLWCLLMVNQSFRSSPIYLHHGLMFFKLRMYWISFFRSLKQNFRSFEWHPHDVSNESLSANYIYVY